LSNFSIDFFLTFSLLLLSLGAVADLVFTSDQRLFALQGRRSAAVGIPGNCQILELNPATAAIMNTIPITGLPVDFGCGAIEFTDATETVFAVSQFRGDLIGGDVPPQATGFMLTVSRATGAVLTSNVIDGTTGGTPVYDWPTGFSRNPLNGNIWMTQGLGADGFFNEITPGAVVSNEQSTGNNQPVTAIAFDSSGTLYAAYNGGSDKLLVVLCSHSLPHSFLWSRNLEHLHWSPDRHWLLRIEHQNAWACLHPKFC
jgi:hypothetical protein